MSSFNGDQAALLHPDACVFRGTGHTFHIHQETSRQNNRALSLTSDPVCKQIHA